MTVFESFKTKNIDELVDWLDKYGAFDNSPWNVMFDKCYCQKCEPEVLYVADWGTNAEFSWCELHGKCKFFEDMNEVPDNKQVIKLWLESEC